MRGGRTWRFDCMLGRLTRYCTITNLKENVNDFDYFIS